VPSTIRFVESASASDRLDAARTFLESYPPETETMVVGATRDAADDLARLVTIGRGATFSLHRFSLVELAARLALTHMAGQGTAPVTPLGSEAIAARVSFQALDDGALKYYTPVVQFPGFPRALARTLAELRLAGIVPDTLGAAAQGDVTDLLKRFDEQLTSGHVHDLAGLLNAATNAASSDPPPALLTMPLVLLDVAVDSPAHQTFVAALLAHAASVLITLPTGDEETRNCFVD
jgi:ATP-dependent helicase/nuclease subunit B